MYNQKQQSEDPKYTNPIPKIENPENLTPNDLNTINRYLAYDKWKEGGTSDHIERLYICANGEVSLSKIQYKGPFKEYKEYEGKYFSRFTLKKKEVFDENPMSKTYRQYVQKNFPIPVPAYEIVNEFVNPNYKRKEVLKDIEYDIEDVMRFLRAEQGIKKPDINKK